MAIKGKNSAKVEIGSPKPETSLNGNSRKMKKRGISLAFLLVVLRNIQQQFDYLSWCGSIF